MQGRGRGERLSSNIGIEPIAIIDSYPDVNYESSEVIDILLPVTFYFNPSTRLDNVKNLWRFVISYPDTHGYSAVSIAGVWVAILADSLHTVYTGRRRSLAVWWLYYDV